MEPPVAECADLPAAADAAWAAFRLAEVELARFRARLALDARGCQRAVVPRDTLLDLYRLEGLLAISAGDAEGLAVAAARAVVAGPDEPPPPRFGTDLAAAFAARRQQLAGARATVTVEGAGTVWVDGSPITAAAPASLVQGEHLFQVQGPDGSLLAVRLVALTADATLPTPGVGPAAPATLLPPPPPAARPGPPNRRHPAWAFVLAGAGAGLAGGGGAYAAWLNEGCAAGAADPVDCAAIRPYVNLWLGAAVGGAALAVAGTVLGAAGLPAED